MSASYLTLESLPTDIFQQIAYYLNAPDIINMFLTNHTIKNKLDECLNDNFSLCKTYFPMDVNKITNYILKITHVMLHIKNFSTFEEMFPIIQNNYDKIQIYVDIKLEKRFSYDNFYQSANL